MGIFKNENRLIFYRPNRYRLPKGFVVSILVFCLLVIGYFTVSRVSYEVGFNAGKANPSKLNCR